MNELSQNFLHSPELIRSVMQIKTKIKTGDTVIEIGPGKGIITKELLDLGCKVTAVEKDPALFAQLKAKFAGEKNLRLFELDFLEFHLPKSDYKVFANIPFGITSDIVHKLFLGDFVPTEAYLIMQLEAAERFIGMPYTQDKLLPLLLKPFFRMEIVYNFRRDDFTPRPMVDTVLVKIIKQEKPVIALEDRFEYSDFLAFVFNQRRHNIKNDLLDLFTFVQLKKIAKDLRFGLDLAPNNLVLPNWTGLFIKYQQLVSEQKKKQIWGSWAKLLRHREKLNTNSAQKLVSSPDSLY